MFDLSSTYVEDEKCRLAELGFDRDKKRGKKQINFGLMTDGVDRIAALKSQSLKKLVVDGVIQPSRFEKENLAGVTHVDFPGEC